MSKKTKVRATRTATRALKRTESPEEAKEVLAEITAEVEQRILTHSEGRVPGQEVHGHKVAYNYQDLVKMFPIATFTPEETLPLTYQGVTVAALSGIEMHVPQCFKNIYDNHRRMQREVHRLPDRGYIPEIGLGAGALPPEQYREV